MSCDRYQEMMIEALYGELDADGARELETHVAGCDACAARREEMRATIALMNEHRRPDPGDEYFDGYYARLEERMAREASVVDGARSAVRRRSSVSWGYRVAAAVAVLAAGVWIGRATITPSPERRGLDPAVSRGDVPADSSPRIDTPADRDTRVAEANPGDAGPIDGPPVRSTGERARGGENVRVASADDRAREYIERSHVLLLALVNSSPDSSDAGAQHFDLQRERAGMLVSEASVLREDLPGGDNRRMRELVTSLQLILREIANLESRNDFEAVQIIRNRVDREGVLLQIDVEQMRDEDTRTGPERGGAID